METRMGEPVSQTRPRDWVAQEKATNAKLDLTLFLVGYVEERPWWPIQSPNIGRKKKANS